MKRRFLICLAREKEDVDIRIFKVSEECTKEDVLLPKNPIMFTFVHTNATLEEFSSSYMGIQIGFIKKIGFYPKSKEMNYIVDDKTFYFVGEPIKIGQIEGCINSDGQFVRFDEGGTVFGGEFKAEIVEE